MGASTRSLALSLPTSPEVVVQGNVYLKLHVGSENTIKKINRHVFSYQVKMYQHQ